LGAGTTFTLRLPLQSPEIARNAKDHDVDDILRETATFVLHRN
jgi:hypothetical protein